MNQLISILTLSLLFSSVSFGQQYESEYYFTCTLTYNPTGFSAFKFMNSDTPLQEVHLTSALSVQLNQIDSDRLVITILQNSSPHSVPTIIRGSKTAHMALGNSQVTIDCYSFIVN